MIQDKTKKQNMLHTELGIFLTIILASGIIFTPTSSFASPYALQGLVNLITWEVT